MYCKNLDARQSVFFNFLYLHPTKPYFMNSAQLQFETKFFATPKTRLAFLYFSKNSPVIMPFLGNCYENF